MLLKRRLFQGRPRLFQPNHILHNDNSGAPSSKTSYSLIIIILLTALTPLTTVSSSVYKPFSGSNETSVHISASFSMEHGGWIALSECLFRRSSSLVLIVEKSLSVHELVLLASSVDLEKRKQGNRFSEMLLSSMMSHMSGFRASKCCIFTPSSTQTAPSTVPHANSKRLGIDLSKTPWSLQI